MSEGRRFSRVKGVALGLGLVASGVGAHEVYRHVEEVTAQKESQEKEKRIKEWVAKFEAQRLKLQGIIPKNGDDGEKRAQIIRFGVDFIDILNDLFPDFEERPGFGLLRIEGADKILDNIELIFRQIDSTIRGMDKDK